MKSLRILMTNTSLVHYAGSELFVRDVAVELLRRGHTPVVYSPRLGEVAEAIRGATISVVDDLNKLGRAPDLIHGQHHVETMTALSHFQSVPAVLFCHGILPWEEMPVLHPRILKYVAVSEAIRDRMLLQFGIEEQRVALFSNFVDLHRFGVRSTLLPVRPRKGLIFSNHATEDNYVGILRQACALHGLTVDVVGLGYGTETNTPELILEGYDLIFARGRSALESLAAGAAVICLDIEGLASIVTSENLDWFRRNNFGYRTLSRPISVDSVAAEISRYDAGDAVKVSQLVRQSAGLESAVDHILDVYAETLQRWVESTPQEKAVELGSRAMSTYLKYISVSVSYPQRQLELDHLLHENDSIRLQVGQLATENRRLLARIHMLQDELELVKSTVTWKLREYLLKLSVLRRLYLGFSAWVRQTRSSRASTDRMRKE